MNDILEELSQLSKDIVADDRQYDIESCKISLLFPLIESLNYDATIVGDIIVAPIYLQNASYKIDFGLKGEDGLKSIIKVVDYDNNLDNEIANVTAAAMQQEEIEYAIITDCFRYKIYECNHDAAELTEVYSFSLETDEDIDENKLSMLANPCSGTALQEYSEYLDEPEQRPRLSSFENQPEQKQKKTWPKVVIFIACQLVLITIIVVIVLLATGNKITENWFSVFRNDSQGDLNYCDVTSNLTATVDDTSLQLNISFTSSDLPEGSVIKFVLQNGDKQVSLYKEADTIGNITGKFDIPDEWADPIIIVTAYLRFDEQNHVQPLAVRTKYGETGEKLIGKDGAPDKYALSYVKVDYDGEAVRLRQEQLAEEAARKAQKEREEDFNKVTVRYDTVGNIKILPSGFDLNTNNITEARNIYPQIYYDAATKTAYFYVIAGFISQKWSMFTDVAFYADGYSWNYEVGSNDKKQQVNGGYVTEWIYFHQYNIPTLLSDVNLLAASSTSKITFSGYSIKEHLLSQGEKENLAYMLYLFEKYFNDSNVTPTTEWFAKQNTTNISEGSDESSWS